MHERIFHKPWSDSHSESNQTVLSYQEHFPAGREVVERVIPDGTSRLIFNFGDIASSGEPPQAGHPVQVVGAWSSHALVTLKGQMDGFSVPLLPSCARAVLGVPAYEITGQVLQLDDLWRGHGTHLWQRMARERDRAVRVRLLKRAILERTGASEPARIAARATRLIASTSGRMSVGRVAQAVGIGERRIQQIFHEHVGLPPRTYCRIARLHACLNALREKDVVDLAKLAPDLGFCDQAHLTNEFRTLTGLTPRVYIEHAIAGSSKTQRRETV